MRNHESLIKSRGTEIMLKSSKQENADAKRTASLELEFKLEEKNYLLKISF
jgi:hypothetical protein